MARPKEFDQEKALHRAISVFSQKGFAATSTEDLMQAMDVGRQSMYDTFGDKRALFLKALEVYVAESVRAINLELQSPGSPLAAVRRALIQFAERKDLSSTDGCMGINAVCEFGMRDEEVTQITRSAGRLQRQTLMDTLRRAQLEGELDAPTDIESLADFFDSTLAGMRIAAKAGKTRPALKRIAVVASIVFAGTKLSIL
ncbi:TetR/AcrR family transcriptional regulator [Tunturibacter empetritectus]|uniref:AcrR family transcriptional regulator n=1 Tax=Tunturiibacter empetritectus TaxID=3069691 RepID=A0A7W8MTF4_9BACT|nr:TetR/AcrR family transcriptional regulator [Edaphobacter lichenicola]MBB5319407.1 AcrR family transcriptional regulator [Edaphobacter lichenicola]